MSLPDQSLELQTPHSFLLPPTVSDTENDALNYNNLMSSPIISVAPWVGINSESKLWMHCECTYADGSAGIIKLAEAVPVGTSPGAQAFSCELPLDKLSKLADNTIITIILMVSSDGTREKQSLNSVRYSLMFQHPITLINYSRWMTDIGSNLEQLKVHDLILLEAHNAGVDQEGAGWPADQWAACQDDSFTYQLRNGVRALDLRLYRRGETNTHQEFIFEHDGYDANRNLSHCLYGVLEFAEQNPGEIVILDFHEMVLNGREVHVDSIIGIVLGPRCIPSTAKNLTIGQIRSRFPGKNIIIAWNHSRWYCWPKVHQTWTGENLNGERHLYNHILRTMVDPPKNGLWSIFAAGYDLWGPVRFGPSAIHWDMFFNSLRSDRYRQPSKGNMINVDFFAGTGVVDRCINATRTRANNATLSRPVGLTTSNITTNSIHLKWNPPLDNDTVNQYAVFLNDEFVDWKNSMEHTFNGLKAGVTYRLQVLAGFNSGQGAVAEITAAIPDIIKPTPPTDLHFVFFNEVNLARLQWTASTDDVAVIGYQVYRDGFPFGEIVQQTSTIIEAVPYSWYRVRALDAAGNFADSATLTVPRDKIPPSKPTNLRAPTITANSVSLAWYSSSDNVAVIGYRLYRNGTPIEPLISGTYYTDRGLDEATHYVYKVRALDAGGNFADSDPLPVTTADETAPSRPTNLHILTHTDKSALVWYPPTDNVKVIGYEVYRNERLLDKTVDAVLFPIDVTEPYWFRVRALDAAGNYADSEVLASKDYQPPSKPGNLRATTITGNSATLEWVASSDNVAVIGYQISRNNTPIDTVNSTRYTATDLTEGTTYTFKVRALDPAGNGTDSDPLPVTPTRPDTTPPTKPTNFRATAVTDTSATLEWNASSDNVGVTGYMIVKNQVPLTTVLGTRYTVNELTEGTDYFFKVRAMDAAGNGTDSDPLPVTTTKPDTTAPSKPTNLRATTITETSATLEWNASSDNVGVTGYEIFRGNNRIDTANGTRFVVTGLSPGAPYIFKVRAMDAAGNGTYSDPLPVTTTTKPDITPPSKPTNLRATTITHTSATLQWDAASDNVGVVGYQVFIGTTSLITVPGTSHTVNGMAEGGTYIFKVRALDAAGFYADSDPLPVTTLAGNGPTNLTFERSSEIVGLLTWEPPVDSSGVTGYQLSRDRNILGDLPDTYYLFLNLTPGVTHLFEVRANRNGTYSDAVQIRG